MTLKRKRVRPLLDTPSAGTLHSHAYRAVTGVPYREVNSAVVTTLKAK